MQLTAGSVAFVHHALERTRGKAVTAADVTAQGAVVTRGVRPTESDWQPAVVTDQAFGGRLDLAVWCDLTDAQPGDRLDIWARWAAGVERLPHRTGPLDVV